MKKLIPFSLLILMSIVLAACGGNSGAATNAAPPQQNNGGPQMLTLSMVLEVGTLRLEGTQYAVNASQAAELLPLWQELKDMGGGTSSQETYAVMSKIQAAMTSDQLSAIENMQLTGDDLNATLQTLGIASNDIGMETSLIEAVIKLLESKV